MRRSRGQESAWGTSCPEHLEVCMPAPHPTLAPFWDPLPSYFCWLLSSLYQFILWMGTDLSPSLPKVLLYLTDLYCMLGNITVGLQHNAGVRHNSMLPIFLMFLSNAPLGKFLTGTFSRFSLWWPQTTAPLGLPTPSFPRPSFGLLFRESLQERMPKFCLLNRNSAVLRAIFSSRLNMRSIFTGIKAY